MSNDTGSTPSSNVSPDPTPGGNSPAPVANPAGASPGQAPGSPGAAQGTPGKVAPSLADIKAARRAGTTGTSPANGTAAGTDAAQGGLGTAGTGDGQGTPGTGIGSPDKAGTEPAKATPDPALTQFVTLRKQLETYQKQVADLAPAQASHSKLTAAQELAKAGKHYEAIQALGIDFNAAAAQVMNIPPEQRQQLDPALLSRIEAAEAKANAAEAKLKAQEDAQAQAQIEMAREQGREQVRKHVTANAKAYPTLALKPEWVDHALAGADAAYDKVVADLKRDLTTEEKGKLIETALAEAEKYRLNERKVYLAGQEPARPAPTITQDVRGSMGGKPRVQGKITKEQAKEMRRARA